MLNKDYNKALKDIEKRPENKKHITKRKFRTTTRCKSAKINEAKNLKQEHGNELPISAGFFIINPFEVVYYAGGTSNRYRHFAGSYAVQWKMINYAIEHGINRYNFYGISGDFSEDAEDAGVVKFKRAMMPMS